MSNSTGLVNVLWQSNADAAGYSLSNLGGAVLTAGDITLFRDPTSALHAASKQYVDAVATGLDVKASVRAATTGALAAHTRSGNILTASANAAFPAQDGVTLALNDSLLVKDEGGGTHLENGIYTLTQVGDGSNPWKLTRRTDADASIEVTSGMFTFITEGTTQKSEGWVLTTADPITLNTTALSFTQFTGAGEIVAGNGIIKVANTLHFAQSAAYTAGAIPFATSTSAMGFDTANLLWDGTNHRLGLLTASPTHTLTLASTSTGLSSYNTSDQTTNYERATLLWSSNAFQVLMEKGGTGVNRTFNVSGTYAQASGTQTAFSITPTINQSSTAGYTAFLINVTQSGLGSGTKRLMDLQVAASSLVIVDNAGNVGIGVTPVYALHVVANTTDTTQLISGGDFTLTVGNTSSSAQAYFGVHAIANKNAGAAAITGDLRGGWFVAKNSFSQNVTALYGTVNEAQNTSTATITNAYAVYCGTPINSGGGTITAAYGCHVAKQNGSGVTTAWGVYQVDAGDANFFGGTAQFNKTIGIGTAAVATSGIVTSHTFTDPGGTVIGGNVNLTLNTTANNAQSILGVQSSINYSGTNSLTGDFTTGSYVSGSLIAYKASVQVLAASTITSVCAFGFQNIIRSGATITHLAGAVFDTCVNDSGAATVTNVYDIYIKDTINTTLTLTNHYAFYVAAMSHGTNKWAFYNNSAANLYLGTGSVSLGSTTKSARLYLPAGTTAALSAPLKFTSGGRMTTAEVGGFEYNNDFYATRNGGTVRFGLGGSIFDHFADAGNTTTTETDLYSDTLAASTFDADGTKVQAVYGGTLVGHATATRQWKVYFGGTVILDTGALSIATNKSWDCRVFLIRASSSEVRYTVLFTVAGLTTEVYTSSGGVTGLTLTNTQIIKITGQAAATGAATNDIVAKVGHVSILAPA